VRPRLSRGFAVFAGVFEECFGKTGARMVVFGGEFVVKCVVNVDVKQPLFRRRKIRHTSQLFFEPDSSEDSRLRLRCQSIRQSIVGNLLKESGRPEGRPFMRSKASLEGNRSLQLNETR
jgi:hypothetical protein